MSQKLLVFDVSSSFGFFLINSTTTSGLTHAIIPRSTVEGLVGAILGLQSDEYPEKLEASNIAVQLLSPVRKYTIEKNFIHETWLQKAQKYAHPPTELYEGRTRLDFHWQASQELLISPKYRIYFSNPEVDSDLESFLENSKARFIPYLGKSSMIASIKYKGKYDYKRNTSRNHVSISSVVPFVGNMPDIRDDEGVRFSIDDGMSIHLTRDRVSKGSYNVVYSEDINEISVRGVEIYKISMNGQNPNIVFLPARV